ncbi:ferredoxin family protein [Pelosinus sp. UFO1]|uniref:4Fe-4S dicluster domain-containing protein n=1 Tax=Pelosinus sp. UFO1 TaxID=484770 RepID=UPI0004D0B452|nr:4Fe-4S binding protein [Pelosinus sp. UFO1]AIF50554.1 4Fe-4S ferredoxin iron-sulfur binding domain-containing protein [Pelosinus sp. UFO1]
MSKVVVLREYCKSCGLCVDICPKQVLAIGDTTNQKGYYAVVVKDESKCIGCAMCGAMCPDVALEVSRKKRS